MGDFRELRACQEAVALAVRSSDAITKLPSAERFALADQWRRAAYSVVLNIAEGASRRGPREFRRYLDIARGSLHEVAVVLDLVPLRRVRDECAGTVWGLLRSIAARSSSSSLPLGTCGLRQHPAPPAP